MPIKVRNSIQAAEPLSVRGRLSACGHILIGPSMVAEDSRYLQEEVVRLLVLLLLRLPQLHRPAQSLQLWLGRCSCSDSVSVFCLD